MTIGGEHGLLGALVTISRKVDVYARSKRTDGDCTVSVIFLSTVIASPAVTVIEAVSLGAGLLFIVGGFVIRRLILKTEKHHS